MRAAFESRDRRAENALIHKALKVLEERMEYDRINLSGPCWVRKFLALRMAEYEHEVFVALWMDAQNRLIKCDEMFRGTLTQSSVYPREVVKTALRNNAAGVIFAHNHPSGDAKPSAADRALTGHLKTTLALIDVKMHDHFIVGGTKTFSFAEAGLL